RDQPGTRAHALREAGRPPRGSPGADAAHPLPGRVRHLRERHRCAPRGGGPDAMTLLPWYHAAQPDEWLLCIRNGRLLRAGVGIRVGRRPGDVVVRFTSTVQRVSFSAHALSRERLQVFIDGFILWSVSPNGDGPFRAFQKLGVANLDKPPQDLRSPRHLL